MPSHKYELEIVAKDMAGSDVGLTGTATATITITDKNDHAPEFTKPLFQATVNEGVTGVIVNLTVEDKDDPTTGGWRAVYSIINGNPGQSFEMNTNAQNNQGMLTVVKPLDYEISAFHTLLIKVENEDPLVPDVAYGPSSTATVQVTVMDVNEGPIFYPDPMRVTRHENIPIGSGIATLNATDPDSLQHQTIKFAMLKDPAGWLSIHPVKGTVNTTAILDRESTYVKDNAYTAIFMAMDNDDLMNCDGRSGPDDCDGCSRPVKDKFGRRICPWVIDGYLREAGWKNMNSYMHTSAADRKWLWATYPQKEEAIKP
ncbi:UNVERIFIED_CONTAM: hypothetical protein FKN15_043588 [Acipenser sinensis]